LALTFIYHDPGVLHIGSETQRSLPGGQGDRLKQRTGRELIDLNLIVGRTRLKCRNICGDTVRRLAHFERA
jgi:hypothetical protein